MFWSALVHQLNRDRVDCDFRIVRKYRNPPYGHNPMTIELCLMDREGGNIQATPFFNPVFCVKPWAIPFPTLQCKRVKITMVSAVIYYFVLLCRERAERPYRCLDCQYRRELVRVYFTNVEQLYVKFAGERRTGLEKLMGDQARWARYWLPARSLVVKCLENRLDVDPSGEIVVLNRYCPWVYTRLPRTRIRTGDAAEMAYIEYSLCQLYPLTGCVKALHIAFLLFRDTGPYDMTMPRFEPEQRVGYREYMRSDGTLSYFFCLDTIRDMTSAAGFTEVELEYCYVKSVNGRNGKIMKRVWVHGKFQKPVCS